MSSRRARSFREKRDAKPKREPYDLVLIVCEGSKTEPNYLRELIGELRLSTANVEIVGEECGSSPATLVQYALDRFRNAGGFDRVFCVFDRDTHPDFSAAIDRCRALRRPYSGKQVQFTPITSTPCFEYWLILHLKETFKPFMAAGKKSSGDLALESLIGLMPTYAKGSAGIYQLLRSGLQDAKARARRGRNQELQNPFTDVDELVEYLEGVKKV